MILGVEFSWETTSRGARCETASGHTATIAQTSGQWYGYITPPGMDSHRGDVSDDVPSEAVNCAGPSATIEEAQSATETLIEAMASQRAALSDARETLASTPQLRDEELYQSLRAQGYEHEESWAAVEFAQIDMHAR